MLPVGPTLGVATAVVILGANGVAITAAAGALLTATAAIGASASPPGRWRTGCDRPGNRAPSSRRALADLSSGAD